MEDKELIEALKLGNTTVLEHCYKYLPTVLSYVVKNSGSEEDGYDVFQETMMAFYHNAVQSTFELSASLNTYIVAIAKNIWRKKLRKVKKDDMSLEYIKDNRNVMESDYSEIERQEEKIVKLLRLLQEPCKSILHKYYYQNSSLKMIADTMGYKSEKVARQQKYKCMKKIKDQIKLGKLKVE